MQSEELSSAEEKKPLHSLPAASVVQTAWQFRHLKCLSADMPGMLTLQMRQSCCRAAQSMAGQGALYSIQYPDKTLP